MNEAAANPSALPSDRPPTENWPRSRWFTVIVLAFAAHVGFILTFGENKPVVPRAVTDIPALRLASSADELPALADPTLFALPHQHDFAAAGCLNTPEVKPPSFRWTEPPRWLPLSGDNLGAAFGEFVQTNLFAENPLDFKPAPELSKPTLPPEPLPAQNSTMQIEGELAQRELPSQISLTNWPYADVIAPCVAQVFVDPAGNVVSTVILSPSGYDAADQRALELARTLRFAPAPQPTVGKIIFNWHTVPVVPPTASP
jgi:TonB family protein